jgi:hypothetical protein
LNSTLQVDYRRENLIEGEISSISEAVQIDRSFFACQLFVAQYQDEGGGPRLLFEAVK